MKAQLRVNIFEIEYGGWERLEVAIEATDPKNLFVTYPTVEAILNYRANSVREKIASQSLKAFLGGSRTVGKLSALIENRDLIGATAKVNLITLDDFSALATWEAVINGNIEVGKILAVGFVDSFRSLALEQLGIKLDVEERNAAIEERLEGIVKRNYFTDATQDHYLAEHPDASVVPFYAFTNPSDALNKLLTGHPAKYWRSHFGVTTDDALRNCWGANHLERIKSVEALATIKIKKEGLKPTEAIKEAIAAFHYEVWDLDQLIGKGDIRTYNRNKQRESRAARRTKKD